MSAQSLHTTLMNNQMDRWRAGDLKGRDELLKTICGRLERMTAKMLKGFPNVAEWEQTDDVLQSALMRLLRCLEAVRPPSTRDFYNLAAVQIRRELLDLARYYAAGNRRDAPPVGADSEADRLPQIAESGDSNDNLEKWQSFHEAVERLPVEEREVVGLRFYHEWSLAEIAELFQVDERTVRRRWTAAMSKLYEQIGKMIDG